MFNILLICIQQDFQTRENSDSPSSKSVSEVARPPYNPRFKHKQDSGYEPRAKGTPYRPAQSNEYRKAYSWKGGAAGSEQTGGPSRKKRDDDDDTGEIKLLRPPVLVERISKLAAAGFLEDGILLLKNAPLDAQNVIVWNTAIQLALTENKYKLAWSLFVDVSHDRRALSNGVLS